MKTDDFERRLSEQLMKELPPEWRAEILGNAQPRAKARPTRQAGWWHEWLWPSPVAWGTLAAMWVVGLCLNAASREPVSQQARADRPAVTWQMALNRQRELQAALGLLDEPPEPLDRVKTFVPKPRSEISPSCFIV